MQKALRDEFSDSLKKIKQMRENFTECVGDKCREVSRLAYQSIVTMRAEVEASTDVNLLIAGAGQAGERVKAETRELVSAAQESLRKKMDSENA
ncbi:hypothetical protein CKY51_07085 [Xanthomonas maliensis]|nr:hypothetical protein CKY51_07085 [Xanthomonas maliensis]